MHQQNIKHLAGLLKISAHKLRSKALVNCKEITSKCLSFMIQLISVEQQAKRKVERVVTNKNKTAS